MSNSDFHDVLMACLRAPESANVELSIQILKPMADPSVAPGPQMFGSILLACPQQAHTSSAGHPRQPFIHRWRSRESRVRHQAFQCLVQGHEVAYSLAMLGWPVPGTRWNRRRWCPEEKGRRSALIKAYGLSTYPGACWPPLNGISRKSRLCHRLQCGEAESPLVFLAVLETAE